MKLNGKNQFLAFLKGDKGDRGLDGSGINPNLLINGDFRVNQRGKELYTATGTSWIYTADRWRMYNVNNTFNATTKTIKLKGTTTFEQSLEDYKAVAGKTVTLSAKINSLNGSAFKLFIVKGGVGEVVGNVISSTGIVSFTTTIDANITSLRVGIKNTSSDTATFNEIVVDYFKLEIGSVATAFSPRPYAEEFAMCQRYFQRYNFALNMPLPIGVGRNSTTISINFMTPKLRTNPTFKTGGTVKILNSPSTTGLTLVANQYYDGCYRMFVNTSNITEGGGYCLAGETTGYYELDAEIY